MKKNILLLSVVALLTSCSGDDNSTVDPNGILLKKVIYNGAEILTEEYTYNGNKIVKMVSSEGELENYTYTGNLISKSEYFEDGVLSVTNYYEYNSDNQLIRYIELEGGTGYKETYSYNGDGTISVVEYTGDLVSQTTVQGTAVLYIQNDEIIKKTESHSGGVDEDTYTYDSTNSPFKNVLGYDKIMISSSFVEEGISHNVLTHLFTSTGNPTDEFSYSYTFNSDNFPTNAIETDGSGNINTRQYFY